MLELFRFNFRMLGHLGLILGPLGAILGPSWGHLGHSWSLLGAILVYVGGQKWRFRSRRPRTMAGRRCKNDDLMTAYPSWVYVVGHLGHILGHLSSS